MNAKRLIGHFQLAIPEFAFVYFRKATGTFLFAKPAGDCFQQILATYQDREVEVYARASVTEGFTNYMGMVEDTQVAIQRNPLSKHIPKLCDSAKLMSEQLVVEHGADLLHRTASARESADFYVSKLPSSIGNLTHYLSSLKAAATEQVRETARLSLRPGIVTFPCNNTDEQDNVLASYQIASYLMVQNYLEASQRGLVTAGKDPYKCQPLAWCYQFLATGIMTRAMPREQFPGALHSELE